MRGKAPQGGEEPRNGRKKWVTKLINIEVELVVDARDDGNRLRSGQKSSPKNSQHKLRPKRFKSNTNVTMAIDLKGI